MKHYKTREMGVLPDGTPIHEITISSPQGYSFAISEFGARLSSVRVPDRSGTPTEITIGYNTLDAYRSDTQYLGCIVGPYANRISKGGFTVNNTWHAVDKNHGDLHLHGGSAGFHDKLWQLEPYSGDAYQGISCHFRSLRGTYPANIDVTYTVELQDTGVLSFDFHALCDSPCPLNLTNHAYWNLAGKGSIGDHLLTVHSDKRIELDSTLVPTGNIIPVDATSYDFRDAHTIAPALQKLETLGEPGIDTCYVVHQEKPRVARLFDAARVYSKKTGICMEVATSFPGLQVYTGNYMQDIPLRDGSSGNKHDALCLETQYFPDSVHQPAFPNTIVDSEKQFHERTIHRFSCID